MSNEIPIAQRLSLREAGLDEYWLRDHIYDDPACLGLGDLDAVARERQQSSGGRLDLLLAEEDAMYEVEIMLGETDETHIIRTIEYWDNEKRLRPLKQHFAVLIAEHINRRFFNVIQLLSHSIPIIAIQVSLLQTDGRKSLFFTTILDSYEETEDGVSLNDETFDREFWVKKSMWTLDTAEFLVGVTHDIFRDAKLNYVKNYIAINVEGDNYMWLHKRGNNKSSLGFRVPPSLQDEVADLLDKNNISYARKPKYFKITIDKQTIEKNREIFRSIADFVKKKWQS